MRVTPSNSPTVGSELLPANPVSIADGVAAVTISAFTRDLTEAERTAILAADRQRIFVRACGEAEPSRGLSTVHVKLSDYPAGTINWCVDHASLICVGLISSQNASEQDVENLLSQFDRDDVAEHRFVVRLIADARSGVADDVWLQKPYESPPIIRSKKAKGKEA
jgi:hypothetical protein